MASLRAHARVIALLAAGVALVLFQARTKARPDPETIRQQARSFADASSWIGRAAPDFEVALLDGTHMHLADHVGREVVVVNFFATWCGPCRAEMPELQRYARSHAGDGVTLVGIDAEEKHTLVEKFASDLHVTFPIGIDGTGEIGKAYSVSAYPTTVVIGADGRVKLYEVSAIANADVSLDGIVARERTAIRDGHGISADAYRQVLATQPRIASGGPGPLIGRALRIADAMTCPCGCDDKVNACSCATAKQIRARLAANTYDGQSDVDVIQALNREFCVKGGEGMK